MAPKFFKIILDPLEHTLRIPPKFLRKYGKNLPNRSVLLKVPGGSAMEVSLIRCNGETLLQNGWKEFKHRYSLGFGHFLIFKYNGKSQFDVMIYDMSAIEINYPSDSDTEDSLSNIRGKAKIVEDSDSDESNDAGEKRRKQIVVSKEASTAYQKATAFALANKFSNPFFISEMQKSYVSHKFCLNVPRKFANENLHHKRNYLTLHLKNGKTWSVICNNITSAGREKSWFACREFVKDNGVKVGDACIFEAVDDCVWNVIIFQG